MQDGPQHTWPTTLGCAGRDATAWISCKHLMHMQLCHQCVDLGERPNNTQMHRGLQAQQGAGAQVVTSCRTCPCQTWTGICAWSA